MSRNPYLAASRPSSSYTRSSRTSKRNDLTSSKGSLLGRSRSSTALIGGLSYSSGSGYLQPTSNWHRPSSSSRLNRTATNQQESSGDERLQTNRERCTTTTRALSNVSDSGDSLEIPTNQDRNHLKNYQQSKLQQQPQQRLTRSSLQSLESQEDSLDLRQSTRSLDSSATEQSSRSDSVSIASSSIPKHLRQGQLLKSQSLDISQQPIEKNSLLGSMSVDRLLTRAESMSERDLRKLFKDLATENERLRSQIKTFDDREKQRQQDWIRKERQMQRKISELEEENRQAEQWKEEIQRLKDENRSLIRVVTKLSKKN